MRRGSVCESITELSFGFNFEKKKLIHDQQSVRQDDFLSRLLQQQGKRRPKPGRRRGQTEHLWNHRWAPLIRLRPQPRRPSMFCFDRGRVILHKLSRLRNVTMSKPSSKIIFEGGCDLIRKRLHCCAFAAMVQRLPPVPPAKRACLLGVLFCWGRCLQCSIRRLFLIQVRLDLIATITPICILVQECIPALAAKSIWSKFPQSLWRCSSG